MLGISFSELAIVCIVAFFLMQPKDIRKLAGWYKYILKQVTALRTLAQESIREVNKHLGINDSDDGKVRRGYVMDKNKKLFKSSSRTPIPPCHPRRRPTSVRNKKQR